MMKLFSIMSQLQTQYHYKLYSQKVDQHAGGLWFLHSTRQWNDNQLRSLVEYPSREYKYDTKGVRI